MKYVYVRLAEERGRAISAGHRIWVTTPHKDTPAPCCKYEEQHVKHEHLSLNSFIVVYVWIIIAVIITFLTCYMFGNRPYSRITMSRFIRLNLWKNIFWKGAWRIIFTPELTPLTLASVKGLCWGLCWRRLYRVLNFCIVNARSWTNIHAASDENKCECESDLWRLSMVSHTQDLPSAFNLSS